MVADPPAPTIIFLAPLSIAMAMSWPVPIVDAAIGSLSSHPPANVSPDA